MARIPLPKMTAPMMKNMCDARLAQRRKTASAEHANTPSFFQPVLFRIGCHATLHLAMNTTPMTAKKHGARFA